MKNKWNNYKWLIIESQNFMQGHNKLAIFIKSIFKGFSFVGMMEKEFIEDSDC